MFQFAIFVFGIIIGAAGLYLALRKKRIGCESHGVASFVERQQAEKHSRKERILELLKEKGSISNDAIEESLGVSDTTATNYLQELEREGKIEQVGERGRFVSYRSRKDKE